MGFHVRTLVTFALLPETLEPLGLPGIKAGDERFDLLGEGGGVGGIGPVFDSLKDAGEVEQLNGGKGTIVLSGIFLDEIPQGGAELGVERAGEGRALRLPESEALGFGFVGSGDVAVDEGEPDLRRQEIDISLLLGEGGEDVGDMELIESLKGTIGAVEFSAESLTEGGRCFA